MVISIVVGGVDTAANGGGMIATVTATVLLGMDQWGWLLQCCPPRLTDCGLASTIRSGGRRWCWWVGGVSAVWRTRIR